MHTTYHQNGCRLFRTLSTCLQGHRHEPCHCLSPVFTLLKVDVQVIASREVMCSAWQAVLQWVQISPSPIDWHTLPRACKLQLFFVDAEIAEGKCARHYQLGGAVQCIPLITKMGVDCSEPIALAFTMAGRHDDNAISRCRN